MISKCLADIQHCVDCKSSQQHSSTSVHLRHSSMQLLLHLCCIAASTDANTAEQLCLRCHVYVSQPVTTTTCRAKRAEEIGPLPDPTFYPADGEPYKQQQGDIKSLEEWVRRGHHFSALRQCQLVHYLAASQTHPESTPVAWVMTEDATDYWQIGFNKKTDAMNLALSRFQEAEAGEHPCQHV
jgi:hypothetical protein